jgi:hypothetical protein
VHQQGVLSKLFPDHDGPAMHLTAHTLMQCKYCKCAVKLMTEGAPRKGARKSMNKNLSKDPLSLKKTALCRPLGVLTSLTRLPNYQLAPSQRGAGGGSATHKEPTQAPSAYSSQPQDSSNMAATSLPLSLASQCTLP